MSTKDKWEHWLSHDFELPSNASDLIADQLASLDEGYTQSLQRALAAESKLEDREKRLTFAADALAVVERRRDELLSRLDFAADAMAVVERRRDELKAERDGYASGFDALREVVNVNAYMQDTPLWKEVAAIVRGSAVERQSTNSLCSKCGLPQIDGCCCLPE